MARYSFTPGTFYPARVYAVLRRPVENKGLALLRLEFEVFQEIGDQRLSSTGKIACRDVAVGSRAEPAKDPGVIPFIAALAIKEPERVECWIALAKRGNWVTIEFSEADPADHRNPFRSIRPFDPAGYTIVEYDYDLDLQWVRPAQAARSLKISESSVRRSVERYEAEHGANLVRRTPGNHRRINWPLLRNLLD